LVPNIKTKSLCETFEGEKYIQVDGYKEDREHKNIVSMKIRLLKIQFQKPDLLPNGKSLAGDQVTQFGEIIRLQTGNENDSKEMGVSLAL
jgi:hypothetical protein